MLTLFPLGILPELDAHIMDSLKVKKGKLLAHEVLTWRLKSRALWIEQGDSNTKYFHSFATSRCNHKTIWDLDDGSSNLFNNIELLKNMGK